jgi:hypothetical protein
MSESSSDQSSDRRSSYMQGSAAPAGFSALPRPRTRFNGLVSRVFRAHDAREVHLEDLEIWLDDSLATFQLLGASDQAIASVRDNFRDRWRISAKEAPADVWCGEVVFSEGSAPLVFMYPNSPWGRLPGWSFATASQVGVDHMVAHLLEYFEGRDYGEEAACRDQVRLMLARDGILTNAVAALIAFSHRLHKHIRLSTYRPALREHFFQTSR